MDTNMKHNKKAIIIPALLLTLVLLLTAAVPVFAIDERAPELKCSSGILIDANSGTLLYGKEVDKKTSPASLTKLLTCQVVLDNCKDLSGEVTIPEEATGIDGNNMELIEGEKLTVRQLLKALLVYSANDAAVALAIEACGSEEACIDEMNAKARELGCDNSNFISVNGLTNDSKQYVSARDMAKISASAMDIDVVRKMVKKTKITIAATNKSDKRVYKNTNRLLYDKKTKIEVDGKKRTPKYRGTIGTKTGFMLSSGYCLAADVSRDEGEFMAIALNSPTDEARYEDCITMLNYGYANWHSLEMIAPGDGAGKVRIRGGHKPKVKTVVPNGAYITLPREGDDSLASYNVLLDEDLEAPVKAGTKVGVVKLYEGDEKVGEVDVIIGEAAEKGWGPWTSIGISDMTAIAIIAVTLMAIIVIVTAKTKTRKKQKRIQELQRREQLKRAREAARKEAEKRRRDWPF